MLAVSPLHSLGSIPGRDKVFQENFLWLITLCMKENGSISPLWHHTACGHQGRKAYFQSQQTRLKKAPITDVNYTISLVPAKFMSNLVLAILYVASEVVPCCSKYFSASFLSQAFISAQYKSYITDEFQYLNTIKHG